MLEVAQRLEGLARNAPVHAAGVVISPAAAERLVPLYRTNRDEIVTQYDMSGLEKLGLLKMDFLGLTTLTIIDDALKLIEKHAASSSTSKTSRSTTQPPTRSSPRASPAASSSLNRRGMRDILRRYQPTRIEDLTALNALYRPGPIQGGMIDDFIDRKHGRKESSTICPTEAILEETYGVIVYQEQVMQISNGVAGYSLGEADILRRAMGKKKAEEMAKQRDRFIKGAQEQRLPAEEGREDLRPDGAVRRLRLQ